MPGSITSNVQTATARRMAALVASQARSGLGVAEFARLHGIPPSRLSWWRWHLADGDRRRAAARHAESAFAEAVVVSPRAVAPRSNDAPAPVVLDLGGGRRVELRPGFDAETLKRLLAVVTPC